MALLSKKEFAELRETKGDGEPVVVGQQYWKIARRFHQHRANGDLIRKVAVTDMVALRNKVESSAVRLRIDRFISLHHKHSPGNGAA